VSGWIAIKLYKTLKRKFTQRKLRPITTTTSPTNKAQQEVNKAIESRKTTNKQ